MLSYKSKSGDDVCLEASPPFLGGANGSTEKMTAISATLKSYSCGWLRGATFDLCYILGVATLALLAGAAVASQPALFPLIVFLDLWLLGYHHVISTFTRLAFDRDSFKEHRFLVLGLPPLVLFGVIATCLAVGAWILPTTYLYWQWFHYMRQSYGISRIYRRKANQSSVVDDRLTQGMLYLIPIWGILYRSHQSPDQFLWMDLKTLPVPFWIVAIAGAASLLTICCWGLRQLQMLLQGQLPLAHSLYILSHTTIFLTGYLLIPDISQGWLVVNIWHNAQYILLVWMFNNNRFKSGVDVRHRFLSSISQTKKAHAYFLVCLAISTTIYVALYVVLTNAAALLTLAATTPLVLIAYQTINFHHYIVDALIWKVRKMPLRQNLGIAI